MTVFVFKRVPSGLRGTLSKWMLEVETNVFVGKVNALVRERLWHRIETSGEIKDGTALMMWKARTPQGFDVRSLNPKGRYAEDLDGLLLVRIP